MRFPPSGAPTFRAHRTRSSPRRSGLPAPGVRELYLVSENSTSYGKDFGDLRALEKLLPELAAHTRDRPGSCVLSPAGRAAARPGRGDLYDAGGGRVLRSVFPARERLGAASHAPVRRWAALHRVARTIRDLAPHAGARSNVIVGFPGETGADVAELERFLEAAELDAVGVFGYSDEDGTEAAGYDGKVGSATIARRVAQLTDLAEQLTAARAQDRLGSEVGRSRGGGRASRGRTPGPARGGGARRTSST